MKPGWQLLCKTLCVGTTPRLGKIDPCSSLKYLEISIFKCSTPDWRLVRIPGFVEAAHVVDQVDVGKRQLRLEAFIWTRFRYCIKRSLLLGLDQVYYWRYNGKKIIIHMNMDYSVRTFSHMIIIMWKVDPLEEKGVWILIKESFIKVIDTHAKAQVKLNW